MCAFPVCLFPVAVWLLHGRGLKLNSSLILYFFLFSIHSDVSLLQMRSNVCLKPVINYFSRIIQKLQDGLPGNLVGGWDKGQDGSGSGDGFQDS